ncbi:MAG: hypothetical protein P4L90_04350 [Rhodopila sp.]|nr:hypothetical protein [Rhodopila sp.]
MNEALVDHIDSLTSAQSVLRWARETPHAIAVIETQFRYTYADLAALIVKTAKVLRPSVTRPGALVGIECGSRYMHLVLVLACECLGANTVSFVPPELTDDNELLPRCSLLCIEANNAS